MKRATVVNDVKTWDLLIGSPTSQIFHIHAYAVVKLLWTLLSISAWSKVTKLVAMLAARPRVPGESDRERDRVVRIAPDSPMDPITSALRKLHKNLGHHSKNTLLRVLKNSGASADALKKASPSLQLLYQLHQL